MDTRLRLLREFQKMERLIVYMAFATLASIQLARAEKLEKRPGECRNFYFSFPNTAKSGATRGRFSFCKGLSRYPVSAPPPRVGVAAG
jgi:hypothetical protein